ncbi:MAG TPA: DUF1501 domain-containing protein [Pirellulales bacterium]|jgi:hypothetical protein
MLKVYGPADRQPFCDRLSRRNFLRIGALGAAGITLPDLLRAEAAGSGRKRPKSVILIYLVGGPPHLDMFDLKPNAPREVAGPFRPIKTNVPGVEICEHMPRLARMMDRLTVVRSIVDCQADHDAFQSFTGRDPKQNASGGWPTIGATVARLQGAVDPGVPPCVSLCYPCTHGPYNEPGPGFLGVANTPFRPLGDGREDLVLQGITNDRLHDRRRLLASVDRFRREADGRGMMTGIDAFTEQAMGVLTSSRLAEALDLSREDPKTVERYGRGDPTVSIDGNGAPRVPQSFLAARRLVEAGARVVTVNYSKWDWHGHPYGSCFDRCREDLEVLDRALTALLNDLRDRGLEKDVAVAVWGEFGRTPTINANVGRDHWPRVAFGLLAGGGLRTGQVIGATDRVGGEAIERPVKFGEMFATLYHTLGIDVASATVNDLSGRPQFLVDGGLKPLRELL